MTPPRRLFFAAREFRRRWRTPRMAPASHDRWSVFAGALALCVVIALAALLLDGALTLEARRLPDWVRTVFGYITKLGDSGYIFALSVMGIVVPLLMRGRPGVSRERSAALAWLAGRSAYVFAVAAFSGILSQVVKNLVGRARPPLFDQFGAFHFVLPGHTALYASFPSGHTITAFACAAAVGYCAPRLRLALYTVAILVGVSRVVVGSHYASDVLAGAAIGWLSAIVVRRAFAARRLVFRVTGAGVILRGQGRIWPALRRKIG